MREFGREFFVYRLFDKAGELLYVGCSNNLKRRWNEHRSEHPEVTARVLYCRAQGPYTRAVARAMERTAAETEFPLYGWTPQKQSRIVRRNAWERRRQAELMESGWHWHKAWRVTHAEANEKFGPPVTYFNAWRPPEAVAS